jgi:pimeloyl-ACP methyl ester carboxylesterase
VSRALRSSFEALDGCRVHCVSGGSGPPVLLVHGIGVSGTYMLPLARLLVDSCSVLVPDLPGSGKSSRPRRPFSVDEQAAVLGDLLRVRGVQRPVVVANSFGCQVVTALAVAQPETLGPLVLIGPTVDPARRSSRGQLFSALRALGREPEAVVADSVRRAGPRDALGFAATARVVLDDRIEERLPLVAAPTVVVVGERDAFVDAAWAHRASELLPRGRLVLVEGEPHAVHCTRPELVRALVQELLVEEPDHRGGELGPRLEHGDVPALEREQLGVGEQALPLGR